MRLVHKVQKGTRIVACLVAESKGWESARRPDGLFDAVLARVSKRSRFCKVYNKKHEWTEPLFAEPQGGKARLLPSWVLVRFAFADDTDAIARLLAYLAEEQRSQEERRNRAEREQEEEEQRKRAARQERNRQIEAAAAKAGVTPEHVRDGQQLWRVIAKNLPLAERCLCCGKKLTDELSRNRRIGPECWREAESALLTALTFNLVDKGILERSGPEILAMCQQAGYPRLAAQLAEQIQAYQKAIAGGKDPFACIVRA